MLQTWQEQGQGPEGCARLGRLLGDRILPQFALVAPGDAARASVERYVAARFRHCYGADITAFMPQLLTLRCGARLSAVVGMRPAREPLFVEHYLERPVEQVLAERVGAPVRRAQVLEIGNLVATWRGSSQLLMVLLPLLAERLGYRWLVFTATPEVRKLLGRLHFHVVTLGRADGDRLGAERAAWGSYYDREPLVMAGHLPEAVVQLSQQRLPAALAHTFAEQLDALAAEAAI